MGRNVVQYLKFSFGRVRPASFDTGFISVRRSAMDKRTAKKKLDGKHVHEFADLFPPDAGRGVSGSHRRREIGK